MNKSYPELVKETIVDLIQTRCHFVNQYPQTVVIFYIEEIYYQTRCDGLVLQVIFNYEAGEYKRAIFDMPINLDKEAIEKFFYEHMLEAYKDSATSLRLAQYCYPVNEIYKIGGSDE